jgi:hypothetical protein
MVGNSSVTGLGLLVTRGAQSDAVVLLFETYYHFSPSMSLF